MFESFVSNIRSHSNRLTNSLSMENFKLKASETLDNLKSNLTDTTNSISLYFNDVHPRKGPSKTISTPNLNKFCNDRTNLKWPVLVDNKMVWIDYETYQNELAEDDEEPDIVDRFVRVISVNDDGHINCNVS